MKKPLEVDYYGETITLRELSRRTGLSASCLRYRYTNGYRGERLWAQQKHDRTPDEMQKEERLKRLKKEHIGKISGELEIIDIIIKDVPYAKTRCLKCGNIHMSRLNSIVSHGVSHCVECAKNTIRKGTEVILDYNVEGTNVMVLKKSVQGTRKMNKNNTSNHTGVYQRKNGRYYAIIIFQRKRIHLGSFDDLDDAISARKDAEKKYYGTFLEKYKREQPDKWEALEKIGKTK